MAAKVSKSQRRLLDLEKEIKGRGVRLGYERLEYAGLRLRSGLCWFRGTYYLFVDRLKSVHERIELIEGALDELDELASQGRLDSPLFNAAEAAANQEAAQDQDQPAAGPVGEGGDEPA